MSGATPNDVAVAALNLVQAFLGNPNTKVEAGDLRTLINDVHETAMGLAARAVGGDALAAPAPLAALPAPKGKGPKAPKAVALPAVFDPNAQWNDSKVWPGVAREKRQLYSHLIVEHNLQRGPDGIPLPRRPRHLLISEDTMTVADPFSGEYFSMLKRRLYVNYGLSHSDVLEMFNLTDIELPKAGPGFSDSKRRAALKNKLGHYRQGGRDGDEAVAA